MQVVVEQAPERAVTLESPLMFCTSLALKSEVAAGADLPEPLPSPGMLGRLNPPLGVGVEPALDPPHPAIPTIAPTEIAPIRSCLMVMRFLAVVCQRSLRAESPQMIAGATGNPRALPNRENEFTLVQSKQ